MLLKLTCLLLVFAAGNLLPPIRLIIPIPDDELEADENPVNIQFLDGRQVAVCDEEKCADIKFRWPQKAGDAVLVETTASDTNALDVDLDVEYQEILGWGGSFTGSFGANLLDLPPSLADKLVESYFGENGLGYTFGRVPIGSSDFSVRFYTNDDTIGPDYDMKLWSLTYDDLLYKIPPISHALKLVEKRGHKLNLIGSPWTPPLWMKENHAKFFDNLIDDDRVFEAYAKYFIKFLEAYKEKGIDFWGLTIQNEPVTPAKLKNFKYIVSMEIDVADTMRLINEHLGPALVERNLTRDNFKLLIGDDNFGLQNYIVRDILANETSLKYVSGVAFHDYESEQFGYEALTEMYDLMTNKTDLMFMTEFTSSTRDPGRLTGCWERAEDYASDIIEVFARNNSGYIDWNMALNTLGGPSWCKNSVDSPVIVDKEKKAFYKQSAYYTIGQFSRFMQPGSVRVQSEIAEITTIHPITNRTNHRLYALSARTQSSDHLVITILNKYNVPKHIDLKVKRKKGGNLNPGIVKIEARSVSSIVIKL